MRDLLEREERGVLRKLNWANKNQWYIRKESLQMIWLAIVFFKGTIVCVACIITYNMFDSLDSGVAVLVAVTVAVVDSAVKVAPTEGPAWKRREGLMT